MDHLTNRFSRRSMLKASGCGFGYLAFAGLSSWAAEKAKPLAAKQPHVPARAKHVIFLCMEGAPSHVDTFDYKPRINTEDGKPFTSTRVATGKLMGSPWKFKQYGQCGHYVSELFPEMATCVDDMCFLHGCQTDVPAHPQAFAQLHTGSFQFKRPSMGGVDALRPGDGER